jgi:hypothetical protein
VTSDRTTSHSHRVSPRNYPPFGGSSTLRETPNLKKQWKDAQRTEAVSDPAKSLAGGMRLVRVGIGRLHDFSQELESRIFEGAIVEMAELGGLHHRYERIAA